MKLNSSDEGELNRHVSVYFEGRKRGVDLKEDYHCF